MLSRYGSLAHPHTTKDTRRVILNVLVKNLALDSNARSFAGTLRMTRIVIPSNARNLRLTGSAVRHVELPGVGERRCFAALCMTLFESP